MGPEDERGAFLLGHQKCRSEVNGVEGTKGRGEGLGGPGEDLPRELDEPDLLEEPEDVSAPQSEFGTALRLPQLQAIEGAQALDLGELAGDRLVNGVPLRERAALAEHDAQED